MIDKVMFFKSNWNSSYDFYGVFYESGRTRTYPSFNSLPKTVRNYMSGKHSTLVGYDKYEQYTEFEIR